MIHDILVALQTRLRAKGCPVPVVMGPEPTQTTTGARERIVVERLYEPEVFDHVRGQHGNPKHIGNRHPKVKIGIFAQSAKTGALTFEHESRVDHIVDVVWACMDRVAREDLQIAMSLNGQFLRPEDLAQSARLPGAAYEMTLEVLRAVRDVDFVGEAKPELEIDGDLLCNTTQVRLENAPEEAPAVTGCGGDCDG